MRGRTRFGLLGTALATASQARKRGFGCCFLFVDAVVAAVAILRLSVSGLAVVDDGVASSRRRRRRSRHHGRWGVFRASSALEFKIRHVRLSHARARARARVVNR
ncbi:unnamed protein product [Ectocarpus sp. 12 AP-2014]